MNTPATRERHTVPAAHGAQLLRLVRRWNVTPEQLLDGCEVTEGDLEVPHALLPLETMNHLIARARTLTAEPGLGFHLGLQKRASLYGFLGLGVANAASLGDALELAVKFTRVVTNALSLRLRVDGSIAALIVEEHADLGNVHDVALISFLVGLGQIGNALTGRELTRDFELTIPEPHYFYRFAHLLPGARFAQNLTQIIFDAADLELPVIAADESWLNLARQQCEEALDAASFENTIDARVRRVLWNGESNRSFAEVAAELHVSPRTLARRLAEQGHAFSDLVDQERLEKAQLLLRSSRYTIKEVTNRLGYSTTTNFTRAFRRWTGATPAAYRRARVKAA
jgi:AraC-like DNA-binding protein